MNLKSFIGWKLLLIMAFFAGILQMTLGLIEWSYTGREIHFSKSTLIEFVVSYINLLFVAGVTFKMINWLNKRISWSGKTAILRFVIDIILFSTVTLGWIVLINQLIYYFTTNELIPKSELLYLLGVGCIVNLFLIPIIELMSLMNIYYKAELNNRQLLHENTRFRFEILKNQINPHFLFNSLSLLSSLISISPVKAKQYVSRFSNVLRHVLSFTDANSIPLKFEKSFLENYIYLLTMRFERALQVQLHFPEQYSNNHILPMVIQLLIENAVKHNKMSDEEPIEIKVIAGEEGVTISNPIRKKSSMGSWGIGLKNIKMRYASLGYQVEINDTRGYFYVHIPYINSNEGSYN